MHVLLFFILGNGNLSHLQAGHYLLKPAMKVQMIVKKLA